MHARRFHSKHKGQSIPLIALLLVVLFAMVALSVDVGNTYAENRNAVRATNAAALSGMDRLIHNGSDEAIAASIKASFQSNGITAQLDPASVLGPGERRIFATYLDAGGNPLGGNCQIGKCPSVPANVAYLRLRTEGTVDTYFARVVGRDTLPVNAQAFAAQCSPVKGVYPIAINAADLDANGFIPPADPAEAKYYGKYIDPQYPNGLTQRRVYRKTNFGTPGSFSWLQWMGDPSAGNAANTANMLSGDGNLDLGFQEVVPWPNQNEPKPDGYPVLPGQISEGDWIHGNTGFSGSSAVNAALDFHIANRTVLNLPIVDKVVGSGQNTSFQMQRMGAFYLRGYSTQGGTNAYFDLVYLGDADKTACLNTNVNLDLKGLGLVGQVYVNPRWLQEQPPHQPIAYQIVLDVSGSMSWDFNGYGVYGGSKRQCESPTNPNPLNLSYTDKCNGGNNSAWQPQSERRVYVAKQAIYNFIDSMGDQDMMRVIAFSSDSSNKAKLTTSSAWTGNKATLRQEVENAGAYNGNDYLTSGGTAGPDALSKASKMFLASNGYTSTAPNGQAYKPVVIYLTDGVANIFLGGGANTARDICGNLTSSQALNTASPCQIGYTSNNTARPITAMIDIANTMKADISNLSIYVVGLAQAPETGLPRVASAPEKYFSAENGFEVNGILSQIQDIEENNTCTPAGGYAWVNKIDGSHTPANPPASGVYGYVYIYEPGKPTPKYTLPIEHDTSLGAGGLSFSIPPPDPNDPNSVGVTPGNYEMQAYVLYKGDDQITRSYDYFINQSTLSGAPRISFTVSPAATIGSSVPLAPVFLDLDPTKFICPPSP